MLAVFDEYGGQAKFVMVQRRLGASRTSLQRTLGALVDMALVRKNEGYGHPLRPEYLATEAGRLLGPAARALLTELERQDLTDVGLRKWSIPVLRALDGPSNQFNALQGALGAITPRALSHALGDVEEAGWIQRRLQQTRPPRWEYGLLPKSEALTTAAGLLETKLSS